MMTYCSPCYITIVYVHSKKKFTFLFGMSIFYEIINQQNLIFFRILTNFKFFPLFLFTQIYPSLCFSFVRFFPSLIIMLDNNDSLTGFIFHFSLHLFQEKNKNRYFHYFSYSRITGILSLGFSSFFFSLFLFHLSCFLKGSILH